MKARRRLDQELVRRQLVSGRTVAREVIGAGRVTVDGAPATKASRLVSPGEAVVVAGPPQRYVSRGGRKLEAALVGFGLDSTIEVSSGLIVLWQFRHVMPESRERAALRMMSIAFLALALFVGFESARALVTGGHLGGDRVTDVLVDAGGGERFESPRIDTPHTHGTGCTLASAVATGLAQGMELRDCVTRAGAYVREAIRTAPGYGAGHGPLNHAHTVRPFGDGSDAM